MSPEQLKYISLITLTIQNAALNLVMRAARTQKEQFSTAIAVTLAEILKLVTCIALLLYEEVTVERTLKSLQVNVVINYMDTLKVAVPSFIYYIQNNLLYVGSTHLDAATCQVTYQLKILTTALFSVTMLNKKLTRLQWISLVALFAGVALIEAVAVANNDNTMRLSEDSAPDAFNNSDFDYDEEMRPVEKDSSHHDKPLIGFVAILIACCMSGFAGVYFEKILKNTANVSLWIRNIQLSVVAIPIGIAQVLLTEHEQIFSKGLLYGFTPLAWVCIILQAQGGLLVALVVKFANNILKGFATSMAIVISTVASVVLFDFELTPSFVFGASLVIGSVMMYNKQ
jgi:UDP-sugar transporter A1/2/3